MPEHIQQFITRWKSADGSERANYQLFLTELCALYELPHPHVSSSSAADNHYVSERHVVFNNPDGAQNSGFIDLYRRDKVKRPTEKRQPTRTAVSSISTAATAVSDAFFLSVLSSRTHVAWALAIGDTLEDRPRYNKSRCFETFPFPELSGNNAHASAISLNRSTCAARSAKNSTRRSSSPTSTTCSKDSARAKS